MEQFNSKDISSNLYVNRIQYIDIAKGIGILFVLIGHTSISPILTNFIYGFHMPLFFYLSGIFAISLNFKNIVYKNKRFVFMYFLVGLFFIVLNSLRLHEIQEDSFFHLLQTTPLEIWNIKWFGVAWFLLSFFIVKILTSFSFFQSLSMGIIVFLVSYYVNMYFDGLLLNFPLCIGPALMLVIFYNFGKFHKNIIKLYSKRNLFLILIVFLILNLIVIYVFDGRYEKLVNYHHMQILYNPLLGLLVAITGIIVIIYISRFIEHTNKTASNVFSFLGKHSLFIYLSHLFFFYIYKKLFSYLFLSLQTNLYLINISVVIMTLVNSAVLLSLYEQLNKKFKYE